MAQSIQLIEKGQAAPHFTFQDAQGTEHSTRGLLGNPWVVYFYPRDDTPGCTKEACGFRDRHPDFDAIGATVIGVSPDDDASHSKFRDKYNLPFGLAADTDSKIAESYGAWGPKKFMGRSYEGVHRVTFVIGKDGRIAEVFPKVKPVEHAEEVIRALEAL
ncbi:MAG: thioredoxin-dependent thiol peroxidase [Opitutales bacterium]|nr:thioredoxin-dependent thiol peroxidase [Opitutales bacterium]